VLSIVRPVPRGLARIASILVLIAWCAVMIALIRRSYVDATSTLSTDLRRYGTASVWRGVYYRGEKIGFTVSQTVPEADGFRLEEDGRLQMSLLGATTAATMRTSAHVDSEFRLRAFEFSLDPGTGPVRVNGRLDGLRLDLDITTASGTRHETRTLKEPPALTMNLSRLLANGGLVPGARHRWNVLDPATLSNSPIDVEIGRREIVRSGGFKPIPAFRVETLYAGLKTTSWVTDTGEVVREESPLGMITVRESADRAQAMAVPGAIQQDLLEAAAVVPRARRPIDEPRAVRRVRMRVTGLDAADLPLADMQGVGQRIDGNIVELRDPQTLRSEARDPSAAQYLAPEPLIESDAPEIQAEAAKAIRGEADDRARAERLTRYVNALLDKKPTVSLPSALDVLRTKVGDCNEHTALYVAMARASGLPARIAVGLVYVHGAFYYHAWPEVYLDEGGRGLWLPVDPTLNEFPADAMHLRLARGGLDKQAAILPLIGRLAIDVLDVELAPDATPVLVGRTPADLGPLAIPIPQRESSCCACRR
jgi:transglutaminase-like putative cysteine protease